MDGLNTVVEFEMMMVMRMFEVKHLTFLRMHGNRMIWKEEKKHEFVDLRPIENVCGGN